MIKLSTNELMLQWQNQAMFLFDSCSAFDQGRTIEAIRITTALRILLHDTNASKSLLGQLGYKTDFFDSRLKQNPDANLLPIHTAGLPLISTLFGNSIHSFRPNFGAITDYPKIDFDSWWNLVVITDMEGKEFTRKQIILAVANKDGGAHVDPELDEDYYKLTRLNSIQHFTSATNPDGGLPKQIDFKDLIQVSSPLALYYTVRQIAHEVLISRVDPSKSSMGIESLYPFFNEGLFAGTSIADIWLY